MNAEEKKPIMFDDIVYTKSNPPSPGNIHDFVQHFGTDEEGFISYPLWLYYDKDYKLILRFYGLMRPNEIRKVLDEITRKAK